jgi:hypothetical protein
MQSFAFAGAGRGLLLMLRHFAERAASLWCSLSLLSLFLDGDPFAFFASVGG